MGDYGVSFKVRLAGDRETVIRIFFGMGQHIVHRMPRRETLRHISSPVRKFLSVMPLAVGPSLEYINP